MRKLKSVQFKNPVDVKGNKSFFKASDGFEIVLEMPMVHIRKNGVCKTSSLFNAIQYEFDTYAHVFDDAKKKTKKTTKTK